MKLQLQTELTALCAISSGYMPTYVEYIKHMCLTEIRWLNLRKFFTLAQILKKMPNQGPKIIYCSRLGFGTFFFGDLNQSEEFSEIKLPLVEVQRFQSRYLYC